MKRTQRLTDGRPVSLHNPPPPPPPPQREDVFVDNQTADSFAKTQITNQNANRSCVDHKTELQSKKQQRQQQQQQKQSGNSKYPCYMYRADN